MPYWPYALKIFVQDHSRIESLRVILAIDPEISSFIAMNNDVYLDR